MLLQSVRWRWVHAIIDVYHSRWTVDVADTHPVRIANVDYLDKVIRTRVPAHINQIQCVLQPSLFWKLLMQKNLYCIDTLLHKPLIIFLSSRKSSSSGSHGDPEGGVGTKSKSIMLWEVDEVLGSGGLECPSYRIEIEVVVL